MNIPVEYSYAETFVTLSVPEDMLVYLTLSEIKLSISKLLNFIFFYEHAYATVINTKEALINLVRYELETNHLDGHVPNPVLYQPTMVRLYAEYGPNSESLRQSLHKISSLRQARRVVIKFFSNTVPVPTPILSIIERCAQYLFEQPAVQTFGHALRPEARSAIEFENRFMHLCVRCVFQFMRDVWAQGIVGNFSRYYHKDTFIDGQSIDRSFLIFVTIDSPEIVYVLIKSKEGTQVRHITTRGLYYASGAYKTVKTFGLLCKFHLRPSSRPGESIEVVTIPNATSVVTFSRSSQFVPPTEGSAREAKRQSLQAEITRHREDYFGWWFLEFFDSSKHVWRLIGVQKNAGDTCGTFGAPLCAWSGEQRFVGILTFLDAVKALLQNGIWPCDLKFDNMCIRQMGAFWQLELIDIGGVVTSISLFKKLEHRVAHPSGLFDMNSDEFRRILMRIKARKAINIQARHLMLHQLCFELIYNVFFILNPFVANHLYLRGWWNQDWISRHAFQRFVKELPLSRLLIRYMYTLQEPPNVSNFLDELAAALVTVRPVDLPVSHPYAHVLLTPEWRAEFVAAIDNFMRTTSPLNRGPLMHRFIDLPVTRS